jgi:hypothetical protein
MFTNAIFPLIEFGMYFGMRFIPRWMDRGYKCSAKSQYDPPTKATTVMSYVDLYAGPEFEMHFKYSAILNITFVTFMFGLGLPMLFPYALLAMLILWVSEKAMFFYSYRLPPMYDVSLGKNVINKMRAAPIFMVLFGYWFFSSRTLLSNENLTAVQRKSDTPLTGHSAANVFGSKGWEAPAWPLLLFAIIFIIQYFFGNMMYEQLTRCFPSLKIGDITLNEDIDTYWNSLDDHDRKWSDEEERHFRLFNNFDWKDMGCPKGSVKFSMLSD